MRLLRPARRPGRTLTTPPPARGLPSPGPGPTPYSLPRDHAKETSACQQTSSPCSRSARCPGTAKAPSFRTTPATGREARTLAGLDWDPVTTEVYAITGINPDGTEHYEPIAGWKSIARSDTGAILSLNKDTYTVIDHGEMGEIVEAVLAQPNVKWETAGVLDGGRSVWCLALLDEPITLPGR